MNIDDEELNLPSENFGNLEPDAYARRRIVRYPKLHRPTAEDQPDATLARASVPATDDRRTLLKTLIQRRPQGWDWVEMTLPNGEKATLMVFSAWPGHISFGVRANKNIRIKRVEAGG